MLHTLRPHLKTLLIAVALLPASAQGVVIDGIYYSINDDNTATVRDGWDAVGDIVIKQSVTENGTTYPVTGINPYAFLINQRITSVTIPNSVTFIGEHAFGGCGSLTSVTIGDSVASIDELAFFDCFSLVDINVDPANPNYCSEDGVLYDKSQTTLFLVGAGREGELNIPNTVTTIGNHALELCGRLTSVTIPNSVINIGDCAFQACGRLTSMTIPNSVTSIGNYAFGGIRVTSLTIGDSVTTIGDSAFEGCTKLTSLTIPDSVLSIGELTFAGCEGLTSITIGSSVSSIGYGAFCYCNNLNSVYSKNANPPAIGLYPFSDECYNKTTLYVPSGSKPAYQSADCWSDFSRIEEFDPAGIDGVEADAALPMDYFNLNGVKVATIAPGEEPTLPSGIYIIRQGTHIAKTIIR